jgi:hypothetical protein
MAAAWPEIGGRFSRGSLETFSNWPEGMEDAGTIPTPHKPRGDRLMDGGDVGADPGLRAHILGIERRLFARGGLRAVGHRE